MRGNKINSIVTRRPRESTPPGMRETGENPVQNPRCCMHMRLLLME